MIKRDGIGIDDEEFVPGYGCASGAGIQCKK
ncbi:MAG: hypothetical protein ACI823_000858 [Chitinophagales bacterium]|jgi:hypothetical protein